MGKFHPFQVVGRGREKQIQVGENLNYLTVVDFVARSNGTS